MTVWLKRLLWSLLFVLVIAPLIVYVVGFFIREPYLNLLFRAQPRFNVLIREKDKRPELATKMLRALRRQMQLSDSIDVSSLPSEVKELVEKYDKEQFESRNIELARRYVRLSGTNLVALSDVALDHYVSAKADQAFKDVVRRELQSARAYLDALVSGADILALRERVALVGVTELPEGLKQEVRIVGQEFSLVLGTFEQAGTKADRAQVAQKVRELRVKHGGLLKSCEALLMGSQNRSAELERKLLTALDPWQPLLPDWVMKYF